MKTTKTPHSIQSFLNDIANLYKDESLTTLLNDLVAIGTWPTPERPKLKLKRKVD